MTIKDYDYFSGVLFVRGGPVHLQGPSHVEPIHMERGGAEVDSQDGHGGRVTGQLRPRDPHVQLLRQRRHDLRVGPK